MTPEQISHGRHIAEHVMLPGRFTDTEKVLAAALLAVTERQPEPVSGDHRALVLRARETLGIEDGDWCAEHDEDVLAPDRLAALANAAVRLIEERQTSTITRKAGA